MSDVDLYLLMTKFTVGEGCWQWTGGTSGSGYGWIQRQYAHRVVYEWLVGPIPEGMVIDHLCRNTLCVRPDHMEAVTHRENIRRGVFPTGRRGTGHTTCRNGLHPFAPGPCEPCAKAKRRRDIDRLREKYWAKKGMAPPPLVSSGR